MLYINNIVVVTVEAKSHHGPFITEFLKHHDYILVHGELVICYWISIPHGMTYCIKQMPKHVCCSKHLESIQNSILCFHCWQLRLICNMVLSYPSARCICYRKNWVIMVMLYEKWYLSFWQIQLDICTNERENNDFKLTKPARIALVLFILAHF